LEIWNGSSPMTLAVPGTRDQIDRVIPTDGLGAAQPNLTEAAAWLALSARSSPWYFLMPTRVSDALPLYPPWPPLPPSPPNPPSSLNTIAAHARGVAATAFLLARYNDPALTVEPGLYDHGLGGCRTEDTVHIVSGGCELISKAPYKLEIP